MKKVIAILLVLCMAFTLIACGNDSSSSGSSSSPNSSSGGSSPSAGGGGDSSAGSSSNSGDSAGSSAPASASGPKEIGFYDRNYDYTQHKRFKFAYMVPSTGIVYDTFNQQFGVWAERMNMNYTGIWSPPDGSNEAFLSGIEQYCDMDYDGLLTDGDATLAPRIYDICKQYNVTWMSAMSQSRNRNMPYTIMGEYAAGPLYAPNIGFNNIAVGRELATGLIQWKNEAHPSVSWEDTGFISIDWTISPQIHERTLGNKQVWSENYPGFGVYDPDPNSPMRNFYVADIATGGTGADLVTQLLSDPPDANIKVWLISVPIWDYAMSAATAVENMGLADVVAVTNFGSGTGAIALWDAGEPTCIRFSLETASSVFAEAIINALWAMMAGIVTPDTLWPEWQLKWDKGDVYKLSSDIDPVYQVPKVEIGADGNPVIDEPHGYASMLLPLIWVTQENYVEFYGWVDLYDLGPDAAPEARNYPNYPLGKDINAFDARGHVPDYYDKWPSN